MEMMDFIATLALLVAVLAALYARWAVTAAERANQISLHDKKYQVLSAFRELRYQMTAHSGEIQRHHMTGTFTPMYKDAELYFESTIAEKLQQYHDLCFELVLLNTRLNREDLSEEGEVEIHADQQKLLAEEEARAIELEALLTQALNIT